MSMERPRLQLQACLDKDDPVCMHFAAATDVMAEPLGPLYPTIFCLAVSA